MKLPKTIPIFHETWPVTIEVRDEDDERCFGDTRVNYKTITIYAEPHERFPKRGSMKSTLFHEAIHAVFEVSGIGALFGEDEDKEEAFVKALEAGLWPLIEQGVFK